VARRGAARVLPPDKGLRAFGGLQIEQMVYE
jgi:hypothetical protein